MFELLFEEKGLPQADLPETLAQTYGGGLGFPERISFANFVSSIDGVAALPEVNDSPAMISDRSKPDRFVMGLLRSCADAVVIGAETLRDTARHLWTPQYVSPEFASEFTEFRRAAGRTPEPSLVVVSASGNIPASHPAVERGALIATTQKGAAAAAEALPSTCRVVPLNEGSSIEPTQLKGFLESEGFRSVLTEAGPNLFGQILEAGHIDELFLTVSPLIAGRGEDERPGIVRGVEFLPHTRRAARLVSVRKADSHLFMRYSLNRSEEET